MEYCINRRHPLKKPKIYDNIDLQQIAVTRYSQNIGGLPPSFCNGLGIFELTNGTKLISCKVSEQENIGNKNVKVLIQFRDSDGNLYERKLSDVTYSKRHGRILKIIKDLLYTNNLAQ